jgi:hypothetical protein
MFEPADFDDRVPDERGKSDHTASDEHGIMTGAGEVHAGADAEGERRCDIALAVEGWLQRLAVERRPGPPQKPHRHEERKDAEEKGAKEEEVGVVAQKVRQQVFIAMRNQRQFQPMGEQQGKQQEERRAQRVRVALLQCIAEFQIRIAHHLLRPGERAPECHRIEDEPGHQLVKQFFQRLQQAHEIHKAFPRWPTPPA